MRPLAVIIGVLFGSSTAIALSLGVVCVIYLAIGMDEPTMRRELPSLLVNTGVFAMLTVVAGIAFHAELTRKPWRLPALGVFLLALAGVGLYYWP